MMQRRLCRNNLILETKKSDFTFGKVILVVFLLIIVYMFLGWWINTSDPVKNENGKSQVVEKSQKNTGDELNILRGLYDEYVQLQTETSRAEIAGRLNIVEGNKFQLISLLSRMEREAKKIPQNKIPPEISRVMY